MEYIDKARLLAILQDRDLEQGIASLQDLPRPDALAHNLQGAQILSDIMQKGGEILIVGDYDADGVCASAVMTRFFAHIGYENMRLIIPHRFDDGYGVSAALLEKYAQNAAVIISVDNGITAISAAQWCKEAGIPLIITDHHTPTEQLPCADVIIDPYLPECTFPQKYICGAVVAWYFCAALKQILKVNVDMGLFLEYLAIASIGDVMPLVGINRLLVKKGLERLKHIDTSFASLIRHKIKHINAQNIAFNLVPLLNCAGRMASADIALKLLVCENLAQAHVLYDTLSALNDERKNVQEQIIESADECLFHAENVVMSYSSGWHEGVLGIVASHLAKTHQKSAFVFNEKDGMLKGSGRSFGGVNLIASITPLSDYLLRFGGHSGAVGLELESAKMHSFLSALSSHLIIEESQDEALLGIIAARDIDWELMEMCESFEPFGEGNPKPVFMCEHLYIESIKPFGKAAAHSEYILHSKMDNVRLVGIEFYAKEREIGQCGNVSFELMRDNFKHRIQLKILEFKTA